MMSVNWWAIAACGIAAMAVGALWYGPLFGKAYIKAMGWANNTPAQKQAMMKGMMWSYVWQFLASLVTAFVLAKFIGWVALPGAMGGVHVALWAWFGFIVMMKFGDSLWGGKKTLFWLSAGSSLITYAVMGAILGGWR